ncbi:MAG: tRNA methyltransferase [Rhodospirillales bacterium RIFCSPLOWO2_12_FULL_58_28]|nr:MAG: tRNA methyltransferase [Rhodospirillales bacterium RIFCSPLOWO2_02_FULL_58_16]OHC78438.1 MAG: tRNA methyltransferase [Rhodospirillales bacterium RIFCSPLOWO2_12_FULL_58_28]
MRLALFEPDIPQNTGAMLRTAACLGIGVDIIEPAGFVLSDKRLHRAGMDYLKLAEITRHDSWASFLDACINNKSRPVLLTAKASVPYGEFRFMADDTLVVGRESAGAPDAVHTACGAAVRIPMVISARSLNVATAAAMALGEALRQTGTFPQSL